MWHRGVPNRSDSMRQMISLNYDAVTRHVENEIKTIVGGKRAKGWREAASSSAAAAGDNPELDRRLLFAADCADAFASPSKYGIDRNVR